MKKLTWLLAKDENGATAIEYGLIAALIAVAASGAIALFADSAIAMWEYVRNSAMSAL